MEYNNRSNNYDKGTLNRNGTSTSCNGIVHTIQRGDTFYLLSRKYRVPLQAIMRANPNVNVYNLQAGMKVCIPTNQTIIQDMVSPELIPESIEIEREYEEDMVIEGEEDLETITDEEPMNEEMGMPGYEEMPEEYEEMPEEDMMYPGDNGIEIDYDGMEMEYEETTPEDMPIPEYRDMETSEEEMMSKVPRMLIQNAGKSVLRRPVKREDEIPVEPPVQPPMEPKVVGRMVEKRVEKTLVLKPLKPIKPYNPTMPFVQAPRKMEQTMQPMQPTMPPYDRSIKRNYRENFDQLSSLPKSNYNYDSYKASSEYAERYGKRVECYVVKYNESVRDVLDKFNMNIEEFLKCNREDEICLKPGTAVYVLTK